MPLVGGYIADAHWGRMKTIQASIGVAMLGHVILVVSALPAVIKHPSSALGAFSVGLVLFGMGEFFSNRALQPILIVKQVWEVSSEHLLPIFGPVEANAVRPNISPLMVEQLNAKKMHVETTKKGEHIIVDPALTTQRIFMYFYMFINIGSITGQVSMVYTERYIGFWLAFLLPTILFAACPLVLITFNKRYVHRPPTGSVLGKSLSLLKFASKDKWSANPVTT